MTDKVKKGFTLIEIVIVLAIAALIMVIVFIAVQGAQRSQRNTARKDVANRFKAAMVTARGNNNGNAVNDATLANYVPAAERTVNGVLLGVTTGAAAVNGCAPGGVTVQWGPPDNASVCLEGGAPYVTPN